MGQHEFITIDCWRHDNVEMVLLTPATFLRKKETGL